MLYLGTAGSGAVNFFNIYYVPLFFEFTKGDGAVTVAVRLLPYVFLLVFGCLLSGAVMQKLNLYAAWYLVSGILCLIGSVMMFRISSSTPASHIYGFQALIGAGCGLTLMSGYGIALAKSPAEKATSAIGYINVAQLTGSSTCLALGGMIFQNVGFNKLSKALDGRGYSDSEILAALGGGYSAIISDSSAEVRAIATKAIGSTIADVYGLAIAGGAAVLVAGLLMRWERLKMA